MHFEYLKRAGISESYVFHFTPFFSPLLSHPYFSTFSPPFPFHSPIESRTLFPQFFRKVCAKQEASFLDIVSKGISLSIRRYYTCNETLIKDERKKVWWVSARWLTYQRCKTKARGRRVTNFARSRTLDV